MGNAPQARSICYPIGSMRALRKMAPGLLLLAVAAMAAQWLARTGSVRQMLPHRSPAALRGMAVAFMGVDVLVVAALIGLLLVRDSWPPKSIERFLPVTARWSWRILLAIVILAYFALGPSFLFIYTLLRK